MGAIIAAVPPDLGVAEETLRVAGLLAQEAHDQVIAVQVRAPVRHGRDTDMVYWDTAADLVPAEAAGHWDEAARRLSAQALRLLPSSVDYAVQIRTGDLVQEMDRAAARARARLIVAGGPRLRSGGIVHAPSDALQLLRHVRRPVVFLPGCQPEQEHGAEHACGGFSAGPAWQAGSRIVLARILVPAGGSGCSRPDLLTLLNLARPGITEIRVAFIRAHDVTRGATAQETPAGSAAMLNRILGELRRAEFRAAGEVVDVPVGRIADAIDLQARRYAATLIAVGMPADRVARWSATRLAGRLLARGSCPVLAAW